MFRAAMLTNATAHCALEYHRWALRSIPRRDGRRFVATVAEAVAVPVLHLQGSSDPAMLETSTRGSDEHVRAPYALRVLDGCGHFPQEERPDEMAALVLGSARRRHGLGRPRPGPPPGRGGLIVRGPGRPRDRLGRPLPPDDPEHLAVPGIGEPGPLTDAEALDQAWGYLVAGLPFHAHELLEERWRQVTGPAARTMWRALAQGAAGITHAARGNEVGARALLARAAAGLREAGGAIPREQWPRDGHGRVLDLEALAARAEAAPARAEAPAPPAEAASAEMGGTLSLPGGLSATTAHGPACSSIWS